ncbi:hypothetical protein H072_3673 [Dactylellina haptotyla CBS 200.50]|uniref:Pyroglutamyl-peptidase I n=1 Tax=Dactylellina haptotyla (strain CBS 200.50) TaxID=1284197 RepID=S8C3W5_DACHA|nr:hypothetical protein H072_3673 [Dactylellina haptotyla CBS 200.50]
MPPPNIVTGQAGQEEPKAPESPTKHHHHAHRLFKVYVTGFGAFEKIDVNASHLVASSLPSVLEEKYISHADAAVKAQKLQVSIIPHIEAVPVSYEKVENLIPTLYEDLPGVDLFVHMGVSPWEHYQIETIGRRGSYGPPDGYPNGRKDVDGKWPAGNAADRAAHGKVPADVQEIHTSLDIKAICEHLEKVKQDSPDDFGVPRVSTDAGLYLCEFIFYNSIAESVFDANYEQEYPESKPITNPTSDPPTTSRAIFIHIPYHTEEEWLAKSRETVKRIIGAIAVQRVSS